MADITACHSTGKDDWATPREFFAQLNDEFHFHMDLAANSENHLCEHWFGPDHLLPSRRDALEWPRACWDGWAYVNPPYSRGLQARFIQLCAEHRRAVMLLPARTDTKVFHRFIWCDRTHCPREGVEVRFLKGRLKFVGAPASAPFPSMVVVFR